MQLVCWEMLFFFPFLLLSFSRNTWITNGLHMVTVTNRLLCSLQVRPMQSWSKQRQNLRLFAFCRRLCLSRWTPLWLFFLNEITVCRRFLFFLITFILCLTERKCGSLANCSRAVRERFLQPRQRVQHHPAAHQHRWHELNGHTGISCLNLYVRVSVLLL